MIYYTTLGRGDHPGERGAARRIGRRPRPLAAGERLADGKIIKIMIIIIIIIVIIII